MTLPVTSATFGDGLSARARGLARGGDANARSVTARRGRRRGARGRRAHGDGRARECEARPPVYNAKEPKELCAYLRSYAVRSDLLPRTAYAF